MIIRRMNLSDIERVAEIEKDLFGVPWSKETLENCLGNKLYYCYVVEKEEQLAGYILLMAVAGEMELLRIATGKVFQRQGLADGLMKTMLIEAESLDIEAITLEVRSRNEAAISLYNKYGFISEGIRKNYYHNPQDDAVIMWRRTV